MIASIKYAALYPDTGHGTLENVTGMFAWHEWGKAGIRVHYRDADGKRRQRTFNLDKWLVWA